MPAQEDLGHEKFHPRAVWWAAPLMVAFDRAGFPNSQGQEKQSHSDFEWGSRVSVRNAPLLPPHVTVLCLLPRPTRYPPR